MAHVNFTKPSKKIVSLLIVVAAIISSILVIKYRQDHPFIPSSLSYSVTDINTFNSANGQDADSQNLANLLSGYNSTSSDATDTANTSDLVARSLFAGYQSLSDNGDSSNDSQQNLASGIAAQVAQSFTYQTYSPQTLKVISVPTKEEIRFFASSLATIQNNILNQIANTGSDQASVKLKKAAGIYKNAADSIYDLPVPIDIANSVIDIVDNYSIVSAVYTDLNNADNDPVMATIAIKYFQQAEQSQRADVAALANYFKDSGIIFTSDDIGNYWTEFQTSQPSGNTSSL